MMSSFDQPHAQDKEMPLNDVFTGVLQRTQVALHRLAGSALVDFSAVVRAGA
jgi:hypothetical protein